MGRILASEAVKIECRFCGGTENECKKCFLVDMSLNLKNRVKKFCEMCALDHDPGNCEGSFAGSQEGMYLEAGMGVVNRTDGNVKCALWPYRLGKGFRDVQPLSEDQKEVLRKRLLDARLRKNSTVRMPETVISE